jgi:hypothetical protein
VGSAAWRSLLARFGRWSAYWDYDFQRTACPFTRNWIPELVSYGWHTKIDNELQIGHNTMTGEP